MKKVKILLSVVAMSFVMIGCGGGGSSNSLPDVDNSKLAADENQYGYFGDSVVFGNTKIVGGWFLFQESSDGSVTLNFQSDGDGTYQRRGGSLYYGDYGVSSDGKLIKAQYENPSVNFSSRSLEIKYKSLLKDYMEVTHVDDGTKETKDCFKVEYKEVSLSGSETADDIIMCP